MHGPVSAAEMSGVWHWHTRPAWSWWQKWVYKEIWKTQDEYRNKTEEQ